MCVCVHGELGALTRPHFGMPSAVSRFPQNVFKKMYFPFFFALIFELGNRGDGKSIGQKSMDYSFWPFLGIFLSKRL